MYATPSCVGHARQPGPRVGAIETNLFPFVIEPSFIVLTDLISKRKAVFRLEIAVLCSPPVTKMVSPSRAI